MTYTILAPVLTAIFSITLVYLNCRLVSREECVSSICYMYFLCREISNARGLDGGVNRFLYPLGW